MEYFTAGALSLLFKQCCRDLQERRECRWPTCLIPSERELVLFVFVSEITLI